MKTLPAFVMSLLGPMVALAGSLPVFMVQPTNVIVSPAGDATLVVSAAGATNFQWRFNGTEISGATNSTPTLANLQTTNSGYYMAVAKNPTGWVPSQMAWLAVVSGPGGTVPLSNTTNTTPVPFKTAVNIDDLRCLVTGEWEAIEQVPVKWVFFRRV